jgi:membrane-bound hydrogenase subunit beta
MTEKNRVTPEELIKSFQEKFSAGITDFRIEKRTSGSMKTEFTHLWIRIDNTIFKDAVKHLFTFEQYPHFAVASGYDLGETIELVYHFSLYSGERSRELSLNITVALPKSNPVIDTITDLIPGALISEQEKQEMLGITVRGIPKDTRVFIADDFPKGVYPWRRDETGPAKLVKNLHEVKK